MTLDDKGEVKMKNLNLLSYEELGKILEKNENWGFNWKNVFSEFEIDYLESEGSRELGNEFYREIDDNIEIAIIHFGVGDKNEEGEYDNYDYKYLVRIK